MNPTIITARITDQHLQLVNEKLIASGGVDVVQIRFEFCGLWDGCGKTAVFYRDPKEVYHVPIADGLATVPWEVLTEAGYFYFGVFGAASNRRPTEVIKVKVVQGAITTATVEPQEPTPNIYEQIIAAYGRMEKELTGAHIYLGSGEMPDEYRVQIDPDGEVLEMDKELNAESQNPVANSAIAKAIAALAARHESVWVDWNNATENGFYVGTENSPDGYSWYGYAVKNSDDYIVQHAFSINTVYGCVTQCVRAKNGDKWEPWAYENPPMAPGKEYRTTERFNGKPVYTTAVKIASLPNSDVVYLDTAISGQIEDLVEIRGTAADGGMLRDIYHTDEQLTLYLSGSTLVIMADTDASYLSANIIVKYTKA